MGKTNYKSLKELTNELTEKLDQLSIGNLQLDEIEELTDQAKELYERLVIIRYKAYEGRENNTESGELKTELVEEEVLEIEEPIEAEEDLMMFDFSSTDDIPASPTSGSIPEIKEGEPVAEIENDVDNSVDRSLNDNYKKEDESVASDYEKAPILDLKEHIGINRKFLYVNELFNGDGNAYNSAIGALNSCNSEEEAFEKINVLKTEQGWETENSTVVGFIELVERRYL